MPVFIELGSIILFFRVEYCRDMPIQVDTDAMHGHPLWVGVDCQDSRPPGSKGQRWQEDRIWRATGYAEPVLLQGLPGVLV